MLSDEYIRKLQAQHPTENDPMPFAKAVIAACEAKLGEPHMTLSLGTQLFKKPEIKP